MLGYSTENTVVAQIFAASQLTGQWLDKQAVSRLSPEAIGATFATIYKAIHEVYVHPD